MSGEAASLHGDGGHGAAHGMQVAVAQDQFSSGPEAVGDEQPAGPTKLTILHKDCRAVRAEAANAPVCADGASAHSHVLKAAPAQ